MNASYQITSTDPNTTAPLFSHHLSMCSMPERSVQVIELTWGKEDENKVVSAKERTRRSTARLGGDLTTRPKSVNTIMAVARITMKSLAKFGVCLTILLTTVAGEWLISEFIYLFFWIREMCFSWIFNQFLLSVCRPHRQFGADVAWIISYFSLHPIPVFFFFWTGTALVLIICVWLFCHFSADILLDRLPISDIIFLDHHIVPVCSCVCQVCLHVCPLSTFFILLSVGLISGVICVTHLTLVK